MSHICSKYVSHMNLVVQDVTELTKLLTTGGGSQVTMERLERSIAQLREMFTTRYTYQIYNPFTIREKVKICID